MDGTMRYLQEREKSGRYKERRTMYEKEEKKTIPVMEPCRGDGSVHGSSAVCRLVCGGGEG